MKYGIGVHSRSSARNSAYTRYTNKSRVEAPASNSIQVVMDDLPGRDAICRNRWSGPRTLPRRR
ncbi:hypothetical protein BSU04_37795 [Caballeronia sordidicola]|uniref:Uncharacterized protein n=1 Tax=Caballeronia sordidicola TaxID=196367 RepID=A0A226WR68_CABSO|nr:hypothetical protein BSU04_37795 [Caballeronia sordidicola]